MAAHEGPGPTLITSVQRAFRLLEAMSAHDNGAPAKQLARETDLPLATTYHLLRTLVHDGYVRKLDDGGFVLGDRLGTLRSSGRAQTLLSRRKDLEQLFADHDEMLRDQACAAGGNVSKLPSRRTSALG